MTESEFEITEKTWNPVFLVVLFSALVGIGILFGQYEMRHARLIKTLNDIESFSSEFRLYKQSFGYFPSQDPDRLSTNDTVTENNNSAFSVVSAWDVKRLSLRAFELVGQSRTSDQVQQDEFGGSYLFAPKAFEGPNSLQTPVICLTRIPGAYARAIDAEMDDGKPNEGRLRASATSVADLPATEYKQKDRYVLCLML